MSQKEDKATHPSGIAPVDDSDVGARDQSVKMEGGDENLEVFQRADGAVDFRTVGWVHTAMIFLKST